MILKDASGRSVGIFKLNAYIIKEIIETNKTLGKRFNCARSSDG